MGRHLAFPEIIRRGRQYLALNNLTYFWRCQLWRPYWHDLILRVTPFLSTGATTLSIMKFSLTTLSIKGLYVTSSISETQNGSALKLCWVSSCWVLHFIHFYSECHFDEYHYAECRSAECHYAECRGAFQLTRYQEMAIKVH